MGTVAAGMEQRATSFKRGTPTEAGVTMADQRSKRQDRAREQWSMHVFEGVDDVRRLWNRYDVLTVPRQIGSKLVIGFACSDRIVEAALRLRYRIFNVELGHGTAEAEASGIDRDEFDDQMYHLLLLARETGEVVGTYRVQGVTEALARCGVYSAREFELEGLGERLATCAECGRACISESYRKATSLLALWSGLHSFMAAAGKRWLFGCCSVSSHDPDDGWRVMKTLREKGFMHEELRLPATEAFSCGDPLRESDARFGDPFPLPRLFGAYMRLGVRVVSQPALDREFGTIDFLVLADTRNVKMSSMGIDV